MEEVRAAMKIRYDRNVSDDDCPSATPCPRASSPSLPDDAPRITLPLFEGPLDLLLYLIRRDQIDIHDIPIAPITRQYMEYLDADAASSTSTWPASSW